MDTLRVLAADLAAGTITSVQLVEQALAAIDAPHGEGARTFLFVDREGARSAAEQADRQRAQGVAPTPFCGIPISIKDLFDVRGQVTRAGSRLLQAAPPAQADATIVARLRNAGFVLVGRTNMTEFAYSGLGLNPHYGTPRNPFDRRLGRIPGGSSSGAAVSVTDSMAAAGIGTDTGGSCRIPAAMCGIVGYKPTACRVPRTGVVPLSESLDSVGPLARSVDCCAVLHRLMCGVGAGSAVPARDLRGVSLGIPQHVVLDDLDTFVASAFDAALRRLRDGGARLVDVPFPALSRLPEINAKGGFAAAQAFAWHRRDLAEHEGLYDPRVSVRILKGAEQTAADYIELQRARKALIAEAQEKMQGYNAFIYPTVPMIAPTLAELTDDTEYGRLNVLALRNPSIANFLDACAISIPIHDRGDAPVGMNVLGRHDGDEALFAVAAGLEQALAPRA